MKRNIIIFLVLLASFAVTSCNEWLDVNQNVDAPESVAPHLRLPGILSAHANGIPYDIRAIGPIVQYTTSTSEAPNNFGKHGYQPANDFSGELWRIVYFLQGINLEDLINDSEATQSYTMAGVGYAMKAYSWHMLGTIYSQAPLKDAFVGGLLTHRYDSEEEILMQSKNWAYKAIEYFGKNDQSPYATTRANDFKNADLVYGANKNLWRKFAYAVLARHYILMSNKSTFNADSVIYCVDQSFASSIEDPKCKFDANTSASMNFFGVYRRNLTNTYFTSDWAVQMLTGTIPVFSPTTGEKVDGVYLNPQIITNNTKADGVYDPRIVCLLPTETAASGASFSNLKDYVFYGAEPGKGTRGSAVSFYGTIANAAPSADNSGIGRWLYRDDAPWPLSSYAEMQLIKAEAAWLKGDKVMAFEAFKKGVAAHMDFCESYISSNLILDNNNRVVGGEKIDRAVFRRYANLYLAGPYVGGLSTNDFSLSHIMMQKWLALYMWSFESFNDLRRYHYDLVLGANGLPANGISYTIDKAFHKEDSDPTRIYKGFYIPSAQVSTRKTRLYIDNEGAPCYRIRPRYNSEYMWNVQQLEKLTPISGTAPNYHTSMVWFAKPGN